MSKYYYIYILTNKSNTLYIGVTSDLKVRLFQHRNKLTPGFTNKYNLNKLLYFEVFEDVNDAIRREKQIKGWIRKKKISLIKSTNPSFQDLSDKLRDSSPKAQNDKMSLIKIVMLFLLFIFSSFPVLAANNIHISEVQIEPDQAIEIINTGQTNQDLSGWYLDDNGGTTYFTIPQNTVLYPNACLVFTSNFNLNKSSTDIARLFDTTAPPTSTSSKLIDSFSYSTSPGPGMSFFLLPETGTFVTGQSNLGKYNTSGLDCIFLPTPSIAPTVIPSLTPIPTTTPTPSAVPISYNNIYISEVMAYPESGGQEWVELFNDNDFPVILTDWSIDDGENTGSSPKLFSVTIPAKGYGVINLTSSMFNNSGDSARLLDSNKIERDSFEYVNAARGKSLGRTNFDEDTFCIQEPSKNQQNTSCIVLITPTTTQTIKASLTPTKKAPMSIATSPPSIRTNQSIAQVINKQVKPAPNNQINKPEENVLGISVANSESAIEAPNETSPLRTSLPFLSFSYSLLSIASIILKIKFSVVS